MTADRGQTISRPSCLTVTVTRIFHRFTSLLSHIFMDTFRLIIPDFTFGEEDISEIDMPEEDLEEVIDRYPQLA